MFVNPSMLYEVLNILLQVAFDDGIVFCGLRECDAYIYQDRESMLGVSLRL